MGILAVFALGVILGQFFRWAILLPAAVLIIVVVFVRAALADAGPGGSALQCIMMITVAQIGYVAGLAANIALRSSSKNPVLFDLPARRALGTRTLGRRPSSIAAPPGRRPADKMASKLKM